MEHEVINEGMLSIGFYEALIGHPGVALSTCTTPVHPHSGPLRRTMDLRQISEKFANGFNWTVCHNYAPAEHRIRHYPSSPSLDNNSL
ncbi:hypothetical protein EYZ11_006168 [Aspergillus tanneri]|uniref:Uncharacterized protein n=1 Tax=Aspergillus tanneri TaxID=1220188 RepID=A0A4S3JGL3_9EURO|nr:hypothetical protein EYZ11_006168 [Aspergillus tanneri]